MDAGVEACIRHAHSFVLSSHEFRAAVDDAFEAVAAERGSDGILGSILSDGSGEPGVSRSAAGHVANRAFSACTAPLHRAGLPVPAPTSREIDVVFDANASDGRALNREEFRSFCAELLTRCVGGMVDRAARRFGPPILAGIGAVWLLRSAVRSTLAPLHRLLPPLLLGPVVGIYVACAQAQPPPGRPIDPRELQERMGAMVTSLRESVRYSAREVLRQWRNANR